MDQTEWARPKNPNGKHNIYQPVTGTVEAEDAFQKRHKNHRADPAKGLYFTSMTGKNKRIHRTGSAKGSMFTSMLVGSSINRTLHGTTVVFTENTKLS